ncbi:MAG: tryptophan-rich sensory protein [Eubacteriales bacterium]|nr:tryptophan-rich sensory protein [Eubacteriales bacterium]
MAKWNKNNRASNRIINLIAYLIMIAVNMLANIIPLNGYTTGEVSAKYSNLFTPSAYTFGIWGLIYVLMLVFLLSQIGNSNSHIEIPINTLIGPWFTISCVANILWILSWHYDYIAISLVMMLLLLISLIIINRRIDDAHFDSMRENIGRFGFRIYLGWICAATLANISVLFVTLGWEPYGLAGHLWTIIAILSGALIGIWFIVLSERNAAAAAIIWAYGGILMKHLSKNGYGAQYGAIIVVLIISIALLLFFFKIFVLPVKNNENVKLDV